MSNMRLLHMPGMPHLPNDAQHVIALGQQQGRDGWGIAAPAAAARAACGPGAACRPGAMLLLLLRRGLLRRGRRSLQHRTGERERPAALLPRHSGGRKEVQEGGCSAP